MRDSNFTTFICLSILTMVNLYSFFEVFNGSHDPQNTHLIHQYVTGILSFLFLVIYFKNQLFTSSQVSLKLKILSLVLLFIFTFIHLAPAKLNFAYHHQTDSQSIADHPCCMPQTLVLATPIQINAVAEAFSRFNESPKTEINIFLADPDNKSPPLS